MTPDMDTFRNFVRELVTHLMAYPYPHFTVPHPLARGLHYATIVPSIACMMHTKTLAQQLQDSLHRVH